MNPTQTSGSLDFPFHILVRINERWKSMTLRKLAAILAASSCVFSAAIAQEQLVPFMDPVSRQWGYKLPAGAISIKPRFIGAGKFANARASVEDDKGFAAIDAKGNVIERIVIDTVTAGAKPVLPPSDACSWSGSMASSARYPNAPPSNGLECYIRQLSGTGPSAAIRIDRDERAFVTIHRLPLGVVVVEEFGREGARRRVVLPGVNVDQVLAWRKKIYPDMPRKEGCDEWWATGKANGGVFIEQAWGC